MPTMNSRNTTGLSPDLRYFLEIAETHSLTRAAKKLALGQPALSKAIQKLEKQLNLTLFARDRQGVTLTRAGESLYLKVKKWATDWDGIRTEVTRQSTRIQGEYTLGCHPSVGNDFLPLFLPELLRRHPELRWKVAHDNSRRTMERVLDRKVDFGLVVDPLPYPDLTILRLRTLFLGLWTARDPSPLGDPHSGQAVLYFNPDMPAGHVLFDLIAARGLHFQQLIPINDYEVIRSLIETGGGAGILPSHVALRAIHNLKRIGEAHAGARRGPALQLDADLFLAFRGDFQRTPGSRVIIDVIQQRLKTKRSPPSPTGATHRPESSS